MSRNVAASQKRAWIALAAALIFHTGLISLQSHQRVDRGFVRVWILDLLAPVEKLADRSLFSVHSVWDHYISLVEEHEENVRLRHENDSLRMELMQQKEQILEAQRIRTLAGMTDSHIGKSVIARVIGRDPARSQTVTIDKGAADGLVADMAVISPENCPSLFFATSGCSCACRSGQFTSLQPKTRASNCLRCAPFFRKSASPRKCFRTSSSWWR